MKTIQTIIILALVAMSMLLTGRPAESAITNSNLWDQISHNTVYSNGALSKLFTDSLAGSYEVMYLGFNSPSSSNVYAASAGTIFRNITQDPDNPGGSLILDSLPGITVMVSTIEKTFFNDLSNGPMLNINSGRDPNGNGQGGLRLYELLNDWIIYYPDQSDVVVPKGWVVIGFEENIAGNNWNDLVIAVNANPLNHIAQVIPIPGAVWLLGSGLLGLIGLRRRLY